jgi:hypothetical protein
MRNTFPSREQLMGMSLAQLKLIDVQEQDEEKLLQEIISAKELLNPPLEKVFRGDIPDITTPEQEVKYQEVINKRLEMIQPTNPTPPEVKEGAKCEVCGKTLKTVGALRMHKGKFHKK